MYITLEQAAQNLKESLEVAYAVEDRLAKLLSREGLMTVEDNHVN